MTIIEALVQLRNDLKLWVTNNLRTKVDKVDGMGLSTNDFTTEEKEKLAALDPDATKVTVDSELSSTSTNPVQNKVIYAKLDELTGMNPVSSQIADAIEAIVHPVTSVNNKTGAVILTAVDVGALPNTTTIPSIDGLATETYVDQKVANLVDSSPDTLNTLNELATALGDDPNFATTVATQIGNKVDKEAGKGLSTNDYTVAEKTKLSGIEEGANNTVVDNTLKSDSENPVQNKVVNAAISNLNSLVGDKKVSEQISGAIAEIDYPVDSVNGKTGAVQLTAVDVGALPNTTTIPSIEGLATEKYVTDAIADSAYTLPAATSTVLGGVKVGNGLKTNDGILSVDVIDNLTSTSTTQPLSAAQGKALNDAINSITTDLGNLGGGDMMKATYDKNGDGIIDNAAQLEGHSASYFATATGLSNLSGLVGDTAVSTQITNAINGITPPVSSVNGKTGAVTLSASDVGALPSTTTIPSIAGLATEEFVTNKIAEASLSGQVDLSGYATISYVDSKTVVDSAMSTTSTNPVQNKVVNAAIAGNLVSAKNYTDSEITEWVGDTTVAEQISTAIASKSDSGHTHDDRYYTESEIDTKLSGKANSSHGNHVPETQTADNSKFLRNDNTWQVVTPANIGAAAANHGTHVSYSTTDPVMDGSASAGSASTVARSDHKHPTDTSRAAASALSALQSLVGDTAVSTQISNAIASKANSSDLTSHTGNKSNPHGVTCAQIGAAPQYTYGTTDLTAGTSALTTGTLYFVYE